MIRFSLTGCFLAASLLATSCMCTLNFLLETPLAPAPRVLFVSSGTSEYSQRALEGARAAAHDAGIALTVEAAPPGSTASDQNAILLHANASAYEGVVFSPSNPELQSEVINDLARRTKVVTVGKDCRKLKRLCHVGFRQLDAGRLVARLVRDELPRHGKVALLTSVLLDVGINSSADDRVAGFKEQWSEQGSPSTCAIIDIAIDSGDLQRTAQRVSAMLADSEVTYVVAFDTQAAEAAIRALADSPDARRIPVVTFDPSAAILRAIHDGLQCTAIYEDPYRDGYEAIQRIAVYCHGDATSLPVPGRGEFPLVGELVRKANLVEFLRRTQS